MTNQNSECCKECRKCPDYPFSEGHKDYRTGTWYCHDKNCPCHTTPETNEGLWENDLSAFWDKHNYLKKYDRVGYAHLFRDFDELLTQQRKYIVGRLEERKNKNLSAVNWNDKDNLTPALYRASGENKALSEAQSIISNIHNTDMRGHDMYQDRENKTHTQSEGEKD